MKQFTFLGQIIGTLFALCFIAIFAGWIDVLQGFNASAAIIRDRQYTRHSAGLLFVYLIPLLGVAFLLFPNFLADKFSPYHRSGKRALLPPVSWQILGYMLVVLAFVVLWVFDSARI